MPRLLTPQLVVPEFPALWAEGPERGCGSGFFEDVSVSAGESDTYGSYIEITPGVAQDILITHVNLSHGVGGQNGAGDDKTMFALGAGTAGSERVIGVWNNGPHTGSTANGGCNYNVAVIKLPAPLFIPGGTRLAMKAGRTTTTNDCTAKIAVQYVTLGAASQLGITHVVSPMSWATTSTTQTKGYNTVPNFATSIATSAGSVAEYTAGLPRDVLVYAISCGNASAYTEVGATVKVGAAGVERSVTTGYGMFYTGLAAGYLFHSAVALNFPPVVVRAGTRIGVDAVGGGGYTGALHYVHTNSIIPIDAL